MFRNFMTLKFKGSLNPDRRTKASINRMQLNGKAIKAQLSPYLIQTRIRANRGLSVCVAHTRIHTSGIGH